MKNGWNGMQIRNLIMLYFVSSFGSILGMIATFISVEKIFGSLTHLGLALSLRTVVSIISASVAPTLFSKFGFKRVLIFSEILGLIFVVLLLFSIQEKKFELALISVSFLAAPLSLLAQGIIALIKLKCVDDHSLFRRYSSLITKVMGGGDILIGILAPMLTKFAGINCVYLLNIASYLIALSLILNAKEEFNIQEVSTNTNSKTGFHFNLSDITSVTKVLIGTSIFIGLVPVLAGSQEFAHRFDNMESPDLFIGLLWATEGMGFLLSGFIYTNDNFVKKNSMMIHLSVGLLAIAVLVKSYVLVLLGCVWVTAAYDILFKIERDKRLLHAGNDKDKVLFVSSLFSIVKSTFCTFSPLIIVFFIREISLIGALILFFGVQIIFWILSQKFKVYTKAKALLDD